MDSQQDNIKEKLTIETIIERLKQNTSKSIELGSIISVSFIAFIWALKSMWYFFYLGKFACYGIDSSYIDVESSNVFLQIIYTITLFIVWFCLNLIFYRIASYTKSKIIKIGKLALLFIIEGLGLFIILMGMSNTNIIMLFQEN